MRLKTSALVLFAMAATGTAQAQVPPEIAKRLVAIGRGVCVSETGELYRPLHAGPPYSGVSIARDLSFGSDPMNLVDVFAPASGSGPKPVLIYVSGGAGNRRLAPPNDVAFYDNVGLWAVKNEMVGVLMQRRSGQAWDDPAKDIAKVVQWVSENIRRHKGDPERVFMWALSGGTLSASTYVAHPELHGSRGVGLKGLVIMSSPGFNVLPITSPQGALPACPESQGLPALPAASTDLSRSNLPGLVSSRLPILLAIAELDAPSFISFAETLRDQLCNAGRCPTYVTFKEHNHVSTAMSANTDDQMVTGPLLRWMQTIK